MLDGIDRVVVLCFGLSFFLVEAFFFRGAARRRDEEGGTERMDRTQTDGLADEVSDLGGKLPVFVATAYMYLRCVPLGQARCRAELQVNAGSRLQCRTQKRGRVMINSTSWCE